MNDNHGIENKSYKKPLMLLFLAIFIDLLGFGIIIPIIPFFLIKLGGNAITLGWLVASYSIAQFVFSPLWGKASDYTGRRPIIITGLLGSTIAFTIFGLSDNLVMLFFSRILAGIFTGASLPTARAYIADSTPKSERTHAFALIGIAFGLGFALGPAIGGLLAKVNILGLSSEAVPSFFAAILTFINFIFAFIYLPESLRAQTEIENKPRISLVSSFKYTFSLSDVGFLIIVFLSVNLVFSGFEAIFPLFANRIDSSIGETKVGYIFGIIGIIMIIVQGGFIRPLSKKYKDVQLIAMGLAALSAGFFFIPIVIDFWTIVLAAIPMAVGMAIISPSIHSSITTRVPIDHQGEVMGIYSGLNSLTRVLGPLIAGFLFSYNIKSDFIMGFIIIIILFLMINIRFRGDQS